MPCQDSEIALFKGLILPQPAHPEVFRHNTTVIKGNKLVQVNAPSNARPEAQTIIDCTNCLIMPGMVNCHTHAAMGLLRGLADDLPLDRWLNEYIFPSEGKHVDPDFVYLGTSLSALEMALNGITTFADAYFFMEEAAKAAIGVGLRSVIAQGVLDVPAPDAPHRGAWRERVNHFLSQCPRDPLVTPALFCHSPYLCDPQTFEAAANLARAKDLRLFCHVSETDREVSEIQVRYGLRPVEHLDRLGILGDAFVAVHAIHVSSREQELLAKAGAKVVHCPESNMKMASGTAPIMDLIQLGVTTAIGTDGPASNNNLDLFEEMRSASFMAKLLTKNPEALDARLALRMATIDGARVLGMEDRIGSLEEGKLADVTIVDLDRPHLTPLYDVISHLVYCARGSDVRDVIVNGKIVVERGRLTTVDEKQLQIRVREKASQISRDLNLNRHESFCHDVRKDHV